MAVDAAALPEIHEKRLQGPKLLNWSVGAWFTVALIGQWLFAAYVFAFYGGTPFLRSCTSWEPRK